MWITFQEGVGVYAALERQSLQFGSYVMKLEKA